MRVSPLRSDSYETEPLSNYCPGHADAVVADDERFDALKVVREHIDVDPGRAGIKRIRSQLTQRRSTLDGTTAVESRVASLAIPVMRSVVSAPKKIAEQSPRDGEVHVLPVQGNVYMLVADGTNISASVGPEGIALVNTGAAHMSDKILATVNQLARMVVSQPTTNRCVGATCPGIWGWSSPYVFSAVTSPAATRPIRYIVNTSAVPEHVGQRKACCRGNRSPRRRPGWRHRERGGSAGHCAREHAQPHECPRRETGAFPAEQLADGELLRRVDVDKGGSVDGVIAGLNQILDLAFAEYRSQGGT